VIEEHKVREERYPAFGKIPRHRRPITITEKIDGSNGLILIEQHPEILDEFHVRAGGRTRWLSYETKEADNHGFARWVQENKDTLAADLGVGHHYGEWWGSSINRGYGLLNGDKRFSLFNISRWFEVPFLTPKLCSVPVIAGNIPWLEAESAIGEALTGLRLRGSFAAPGYMKPEGVVIFEHSSNRLSKVTIEKDAEWKGKQAKKSKEELDAEAGELYEKTTADALDEYNESTKAFAAVYNEAMKSANKRFNATIDLISSGRE